MPETIPIADTVAMPAGIEPIDDPSADALAEADWPEIDRSLLQDGHPALPDFPLQSLPPWWRAWVSETAHGAGAPVDYIVQALLASVAGVCGASVVARLTETWSEPLILWQALVGGPSHGKTPALDALRRPLAAVEKTMGREKRGPTVIDHDTPLPQLLKLANKAPAGALLWRDEPAAWFANLGSNGRGLPRQLTTLLDTWSPFKTALGPSSPAISIIGCLDPARVDEALRGGDDGRAARFLYAWPRPAPWRGFLERPALRESDAVNALDRIARTVTDPAAPLALTLDDGALRVLDDHIGRLNQELGRADGVEAAWLGKGRGMVARLAAALTLLDWGARASSMAVPPRAITGEAMGSACRLWDYFRSHARAVLARASPTDRERLMRRVLTWVRTSGATGISREDVRRDALGQALNAAQSQQVIESLERAGFLRKVEVEPGRNGRPAHRWHVNPILTAGAGLAPVTRRAKGDAETAETAETAQTPVPSVVEGPVPSAAEGPVPSAAEGPASRSVNGVHDYWK